MASHPIQKHKALKTHRPLGGSGLAHYSWEQKLEIVARYLASGNMRQVERETNMNYATLMKWKSDDWWPQAVREVREMQGLKTAGKLRKIVESSLDSLEDRLKQGDFYVDSKGQVQRIGIKAATLNQITKDMLERKEKLEKIETQATTEETIDNRLKSLQEEFRKFAKAKTIIGE